MLTYDYRNRVYSADLGRFLQSDPIRFEAGDGNLSRYVGNDSTNHVDPEGLQSICSAPFWQMVNDWTVSRDEDYKSCTTILGVSEVPAPFGVVLRISRIKITSSYTRRNFYMMRQRYVKWCVDPCTRKGIFVAAGGEKTTEYLDSEEKKDGTFTQDVVSGFGHKKTTAYVDWADGSTNLHSGY